MAIIRRFRVRRRRDRRTFRERFSITSMSDEDLRRRFRFSSGTILFILGLVRPFLVRETRRSRAVSPMLQLLTALRFFSTGAFMRLVGDSVGLSEASVSRSVFRVASALVRNARHFITMPRNTQAMKDKFYRLSRFPNVIGAIDCTHIPIQAPSINEPDYVNRKGYHSLNVQMVCDAEYRFTNCVAEWPGSVHDSRIFRNSQLKRNMENGQYDGILVGDSGYPCRPFLMTPFQTPQNDKERNFNRALCRARVTVEQSFGILKRRFACLHNGLRMVPERAALVTVACVVLHNIAMAFNEPLDENIEVPDVGNNDSNVNLPNGNDGATIRRHLCDSHF